VYSSQTFGGVTENIVVQSSTGGQFLYSEMGFFFIKRMFEFFIICYYIYDKTFSSVQGNFTFPLENL